MNSKAKNIIDKKLKDLTKSKFRNSFHLKDKELKIIEEKGILTIRNHAYDLINKNLASSFPKNDGAQTPTKNHPVFIAQHATATCCRTCLEKWHQIPKGKELRPNEINYIVELIMAWIIKDVKDRKNKYDKSV